MSPRAPLVLAAIAILVGAIVWQGCGRSPDEPTSLPAAAAIPSTAATGTRAPREHTDPSPVEEPAPVADDHETWEIVALGRSDRPIAGVTVRLRHEDDARGETGPDGRLLLRMPLDSKPVEADFDGVVSRSGYDTIAGPRTVVRFDDALPLDVRVVDARSGLPLTGSKVALHRLWAATSFPLTTDGDVHRLEFSPAAIGEWWTGFSESFEVEATDGFALLGDDHACRTVVAGGARQGRLTIPVWPAGSVRVRVVDVWRTPVTGTADVELVLAGERLRSRQIELDADGRTVLDGVAVVPEAQLDVIVTAGVRTSPTATVTLRAGASEYDVTVVLPAEPNGVGSRCGGSSGSGGIGYSPKQAGTASLELRVLRHDGSPARRALLCVTGWQWAADPDSADDAPVGTQWREFVRSDENGIALVEHVPTDAPEGGRRGMFGSVSVELRDSGLVPTEKHFELTPSGATSGELREAEGFSIDLTVVDGDGRPVPWAQVAAHRRKTSDDWTWASLDGDVQDLCPQTGLDGRFTFRGLPAGPIEIDAEFGGHRAKGTFTAGQPATLTLPR